MSQSRSRESPRERASPKRTGSLKSLRKHTQRMLDCVPGQGFPNAAQHIGREEDPRIPGSVSIRRQPADGRFDERRGYPPQKADVVTVQAFHGRETIELFRV